MSLIHAAPKSSTTAPEVAGEPQHQQDEQHETEESAAIVGSAPA
jgi:hypothetical protein